MSHCDQLSLIEAESDEALLVAPAETRKRYTAAQVEKIEWKRDMILLAISARVIPLEMIAQRAHVNFRVVKELESRYAQAIASDGMKLAEFAQAMAGDFLYKAAGKADKASPKDLMIMHGIARDTAINMRLTSAGATPESDDVIDVNQESEQRRNFVEKLKRLGPTPADVPVNTKVSE